MVEQVPCRRFIVVQHLVISICIVYYSIQKYTIVYGIQYTVELHRCLTISSLQCNTLVISIYRQLNYTCGLPQVQCHLNLLKGLYLPLTMYSVHAHHHRKNNVELKGPPTLNNGPLLKRRYYFLKGKLFRKYVARSVFTSPCISICVCI